MAITLSYMGNFLRFWNYLVPKRKRPAVLRAGCRFRWLREFVTTESEP